MPGKRHVPLHGAFFSACAIQVEGWRTPRLSCAAGPRAEAALIALSGLRELGEQRVAALTNCGHFSGHTAARVRDGHVPRTLGDADEQRR